MKNQKDENREINTSMENPNLDDRPAILKMTQPWQLITLILLVIITFSAFQAYDAIRSKAHAPGCTIEAYERTGECRS